jgi:hypothetical protein
MVRFVLDPRGGFVVDAELASGDVVIAYNFVGDEPVSFDVYRVRGAEPGKNILWSGHKHFDLNKHERESLRGLLQPGGQRHGIQHQ